MGPRNRCRRTLLPKRSLSGLKLCENMRHWTLARSRTLRYEVAIIEWRFAMEICNGDPAVNKQALSSRCGHVISVCGK